MRVRVDEARHDGLPAHIEHLGSSGPTALCAYAFDPVVLNDDVGILHNLIAFHRHHGRAPQYHRALGRFPRKFQIDGDFLNILFLLFQLLLFFFLVFLFVFLRISRLRSGCVFGARIFLVAFFLFVLWRFERDRAERLAEKARAHRPGNGLAVISPRKIISTNVRQPLCRDGGGSYVDGGRLSAHDRHGN